MKTLLSKIVLSNDQWQELERRERSRTLPQKVVLRAKIILMASKGKSNSVIARTLNLSRPTVIHWRSSFIEKGLDGLEDIPKPGRPPVLSEDTIKDIVSSTMVKPNNATHWSTRMMAKEKSVSHMTVQRIWKKVHHVVFLLFRNHNQFLLFCFSNEQVPVLRLKDLYLLLTINHFCCNSQLLLWLD